jgi:hypothetical protein
MPAKLIQQAVREGLFKSLVFDFVSEEEPLYEMPNPTGIWYLSWAIRPDAEIRWREAKIHRKDGLFRPPYTRLGLQKRLQGTVDQGLASGERLTKALQRIPKLNNAHIVVCYKRESATPSTRVAFGVVVTPRKIETAKILDKAIQKAYSHGNGLELNIPDWANPLELWIRERLGVAKKTSAWDLILEDELFSSPTQET